MANIHRAIGLPSAELVECLLGQEQPEVIEAHSRHFEQLRRRYGVHAIAGVTDLLQRCARAGWTIALATSADKDDLDWMLPLIGASDIVAGATTSEDIQDGKPHPDVLLAAMEAHGLVAEKTVAVGDSIWDIQAADRAGLHRTVRRRHQQVRTTHAGAAEVYPDAANLLDHFAASLLGLRAPFTDRLTS